MKEDEIRASLGAAMRQVLDEDLTLLSLDDLAVRVQSLQSEIERALAVIESKKGSHSNAEALFK
ncbi:DUF1192 family protein [Alphaproteobacteria bacterium]|nr:DUF1192 family protein [Alphaproteobacteria bacterium]MDC0147925.1 DUF1192 family protein [Alphaproteobacteria bacterium]